MSDPNSQQDQTLSAVVTAAAAVLLGLFTAAQLRLLTRFAGLIARYRSGDLLQLRMRREAFTVARELSQQVPQVVAQVVAQAVKDGSGGSGGSDSFGTSEPGRESHAERSARAIREDLVGKLNQLTYRITRFADDAYQAVVADAAQAQVLGLTPAQAQHEAYRKLVRQGVTGLVDSRGRNWELSAYVEMATRTAVERAYNVSHLERMQSLGLDLFTVTDDGHPCPLCLPWQGKILSVGPDSRADATIADATAAGLFHPRCRHALVGFVPGVTVLPPPHVWSAEDQRKYDESQQQRRLEREIRAAKRELAGAFTPEMRSQAQFAVRRAQANMRAFIEQTGRVRNTRREQVNLGAK
jgi:hypothetical protein